MATKTRSKKQIKSTKSVKPEPVEQVEQEQKFYGSLQMLGTANVYDNKNQVQDIAKSERLNIYKGWIYGIVNIISQSIAQAEICVYAEDDPNDPIANYKTIRKSIGATDASIKIDNHPAIKLLSSVNDYMDGYGLISMTQTYLDIIGDAYWYVEKVNNIPSKIYMLEPQYMSIVLDATEKIITGYIYKENTKQPVVYAVEDIIHFTNPSPYNKYYGESPLRALASPIDKIAKANQLERAILANNGAPTIILSTEAALTPQDKKLIEEQWGKSQSRGKQGGVKVMDSRFTVDTIEVDLSKLMLNSQQQFDLKEICLAYNVPYAMIDSTDQLKAGLDQMLKYYNKFCLKPRLARLEQTLNQQFAPMFDEKIWFEFENPDEEDEKQEADILINYVSAGILTKNEARAELGLDPIEDVNQTEGATSEENN